MAYTSTNAENVKLGTCSVTFGATDLGLTKGGVEVSVSTSAYKITVDQFGETEINEYITGRTCTVRVPMAETDLTILSTVIPGSSLVTGAAKTKLVVRSGVGLSLRTFAQKLTLHPVALATSNKEDDVVVPIAAPKGDFQFAFKLDEERVYNVEFTGYPDLATGDLYVIGDETAAVS